MRERFDTFGPPPAEPDPWETATETAMADEDAELDPRAAAALLDQTRRRAERRFELRPPWLTLIAAVVVLVCYGSLWLSVRQQHPYGGPAGWALGVLYGTLAVWAVVNAVVLRRATSGVGGRAARQRAIIGLGVAVIWICVYIVQGALYHAGAGKAVVYGIWPASGVSADGIRLVQADPNPFDPLCTAEVICRDRARVHSRFGCRRSRRLLAQGGNLRVAPFAEVRSLRVASGACLRAARHT